uniref:Uncharacterized protein n=1 Tax=Oryza sativa subsp. japonica TaxID=39947 RepID=Q8LMD9_ORYSJ|nr:Hypothetical protein [Oryza sativa Japonica Group]
MTAARRKKREEEEEERTARWPAARCSPPTAAGGSVRGQARDARRHWIRTEDDRRHRVRAGDSPAEPITRHCRSPSPSLHPSPSTSHSRRGEGGRLLCFVAVTSQVWHPLPHGSGDRRTGRRWWRRWK